MSWSKNFQLKKSSDEERNWPESMGISYQQSAVSMDKVVLRKGYKRNRNKIHNEN